LFRQSIFGRLAGYEDVNDAERLPHDPAMRWVVGGKATISGGASPSQMGRLKRARLAVGKNLSALANLSGRWIDRVHSRRPPRGILLDMDSSVSPTHGEQEKSCWNWHYECTCYHPLFLFNQFGDLERRALRPGNVHSADDWESVLKPVVIRYKGKFARIYFRGDAAFANPDIYEYLEGEGIRYAIRLPANSLLQERIGHLLTRPVGRPPNEVRPLLCELRLSGWKLGETAPGHRQSRVASGRTLSACGLHRHQHGATRRECRRLQQARDLRAIHQGRQGCDQMDTAIVPVVRG
jgi:hypothetical protein